jgi:hypothetical protein
MSALHTTDELKQNFIKNLSNYSLCIQPYVRMIQSKYVSESYMIHSENVDFKAYCKEEMQFTLEAKKQLDAVLQ